MKRKERPKTKETETKEWPYLFSWDNIPGNDNGRFIKFLKHNYNIYLRKTVKIEKIDNDKIIISTVKKYLSLELSDEKTEIILKIDGVLTDKLIVKMENGKLNIYGWPKTKEWPMPGRLEHVPLHSF